MIDLSDLIERVEKAERPTYALFQECYVAVFGEPQFEPPYGGYDAYRKFRTLLEAGAWTDAAMMLVPEHCSSELTSSAAPASSPTLKFTRCRLWDWGRGPVADHTNEWKSEGNRPLPLNIVAAAFKARKGTKAYDRPHQTY